MGRDRARPSDASPAPGAAYADDRTRPLLVTVADRLARTLAPLAALMESLIVEERENEASMTACDRAIADWADMYQGVANALGGLYRIAGRADLAERIRPTVRRAQGLEEAEDTDPTGGGGG